MSTYETAKTLHVAAGEPTFAYRQFGAKSGIPLLFLIHFRGTMDKWDPLLINSIAKERSVILVDYSGIGHSTGRVASSVRESAEDVAKFLHSINVKEVDVLGFSMGGWLAQMIALNHQSKDLRVHHVVICGSSASVGPDMPATENDYLTAATAAKLEIEHFKALFFPRTPEGEKACEEWWVRLQSRNEASTGETPSDWASQELADGGQALQMQGQAYPAFQGRDTSRGLEGTYDRLGELKMPVLVAQGSVSSAPAVVLLTGEIMTDTTTGRLHVPDLEQLPAPAKGSKWSSRGVSEQRTRVPISVC